MGKGETHKVRKTCSILHLISAKRKIKQIKGIEHEGEGMNRADCTTVRSEKDLNFPHPADGLSPPSTQSRMGRHWKVLSRSNMT